ncbi:MAG TPA: ATP-binding cassette domain-containing protein, partial [Acidobacteriota bacterium]|nr:ATP-binding cassette domain-containing protein [Acidobacteriota bacterium]
MTTTSAALEIRAVTKCYGELKAVQNVSFTVENGIFGLLGANGAGKSTLLKSILGVIPIESGEVL